MFTFTDQNVYKCIAGMANIYSSLDRGNEGLNDGVNLRLPSGTGILAGGPLRDQTPYRHPSRREQSPRPRAAVRRVR